MDPSPRSLSFLNNCRIITFFECTMFCSDCGTVFSNACWANRYLNTSLVLFPLPVGSWITTSRHQSTSASGSQVGAPLAQWARPLMPAILITSTITDPLMMPIGSLGAARPTPDRVVESAVMLTQHASRRDGSSAAWAQRVSSSRCGPAGGGGGGGRRRSWVDATWLAGPVPDACRPPRRPA